MDNMNFNQNDNFYGPLFSNNNLESSFTNENDLPPELGEIKNLNDATVVQAPTMDALGPANFVTENQRLVNDPLEFYEKKGFSGNDFPSQPIEQNNSSTINQTFNNDFTNSLFNENNVIQNNFYGINSEIEKNNNISSNYDSFESMNIENSFNISENNEVETNDFTNNSFNENNIIQNNFSSLNSETEINNDISGNNDFFESTNIENSFNISENNEVETNDFEIINKSLTQDTFEEKELLDKDTNSIELPNAEDIIDPSEVENITDVSSLGLDEAYTEPDSLEIIDTELFDEEDEINTIEEPIVQIDKENDSEEIKSIKKLVKELKAKGKNIKVEEFDFENMHQLIIIMEK